MTRLILPLALLAALSFAQSTPRSSISGVIRDGDGNPLADSRVVARGPGRSETASNASGEYELKDLAAGRYNIFASFQPPAFARRIVTLAPGQDLTDVDVQIEQSADVRGRVLDDNGEPMPGVQVYLIGTEYRHGRLRHTYRGVSPTDDRGEYSMAGRARPGVRYAVMAKVRPGAIRAVSEAPLEIEARRPAFPTTFFPNSPDLAGAERLVLRSGEVREGVDIAMRRSQSYCISGLLQLGGAPAALTFSLTELQPSSGMHTEGGFFSMTPRVETGADGLFRLCDLARGEYYLMAHSRGPDLAGIGSAEIVVVDHDVNDLTISVLPFAELPGDVVWAGEAPKEAPSREVRIDVRPVYRASFQAERAGATTTIPGEFLCGGLAPDPLEISVRNLDDDWYVADIEYGGKSIVNGVLRVGEARQGSRLRITIGRDAGEIEVAVKDEDGGPEPNSTVYVLPESAVNEAELAQMMTKGSPDQLGLYRSGALRPGAYRVVAVRAKLDLSPESIHRLWVARRDGVEIGVQPESRETIDVEITPL